MIIHLHYSFEESKIGILRYGGSEGVQRTSNQTNEVLKYILRCML